MQEQPLAAMLSPITYFTQLQSLQATFIHLSVEQRTAFLSINLNFFQIVLIFLSGAPDQ